MSIEKDNVVTMFYELKDANSNELLESNLHSNPLSFILGKGQILESLEEEISKLTCPCNASITIKKEKALGEYDNNAVQILPKEQFAGINLNIGMELFGESEDGSNVKVIVKDISDDKVTIDYNHPYAGKDLQFDINLLEVRPASEEELITGIIAGSQSCCGGHHHNHHDDDGCCGGCHH